MFTILLASILAIRPVLIDDRAATGVQQTFLASGHRTMPTSTKEPSVSPMPGASDRSTTCAHNIVDRVTPSYTNTAVNSRVQGTVVISILVDDGLPRDPRVVRSIGFGLDEKAVEAVMKWRFHANANTSEPLEHIIEINFRLL